MRDYLSEATSVPVYGTIIVGGDYKGNLGELANVLNSFDWCDSNDFPKFTAYEDKGVVGLINPRVQRPTIVPTRGVLAFRDGRRVYLDEASDPTIFEWQDEDNDSEVEAYTLQQLSAIIAPSLDAGTIELVALGNEQDRYVHLDRLVIRSDGYAERHCNACNIDAPGRWSTCESEYYDPRSQVLAA